MNRVVMTLITAYFFTLCAESQIVIHTDQVANFHKLMKYSEDLSNSKLSVRRGNFNELQRSFDNNNRDLQFRLLLDTLLNTSVLYTDEVIGGVTTYDFKDATGEQAYRLAFTLLPGYCVNITGGMTESWVRYWNSEHPQIVDKLIKRVTESQDTIISEIKRDCKLLLPEDSDLDLQININTIVDGNRGSFQFGNNVMMDMINRDYADFSRFVSVIKHEMHHAYYREWMDRRYNNKERAEADGYFYEFQKSFAFEGIAQRYTYDNYSKEVKQLYSNSDLISELFDEWISLIRATNSPSVLEIFYNYMESQYDNEIKRLKQYYPGNSDSVEFQYRPNFTYYLSYNIYNSIFEIGGLKLLKYVIENPDKLLSTYNKHHVDSMLIPLIPNDVIEKWESNF